MRSFAGLVLFLLLVGGLAAGCGTERAGQGLENAPLAYLPERSGLVLVVPTDLENDQVEAFDEQVARELFGQRVETLLRAFADQLRLSFEEDIAPLLGNPLVLGTQSEEGLLEDGDPGFTAALRVRSAERLRDVLERLPDLRRTGEEMGADVWEVAPAGPALAVDGDVLVFAEDRATLDEALAQPDGDDRLTAETFAAALEGLPEDALVRGYASPDGALASSELAGLRELAWFDALRTVGFTVSFRGEEELVLDARLDTDGSRLTDGDLPVAAGEEAPEVPVREGEIAAANRDQSKTTVFLLRAAQAALPDSRFVREVEAVERELGIDFADEVLRQFAGPSASAVTVDGQEFAARSTVADPERLEELLRGLAPRVPGLIEGLQGLRSQGLALLLLFAPDAPVTTSALEQVRVEAPDEEGDLYRVWGLTGDGPDELYFGLVDDVFVVASDEERAREIAAAPTRDVDGARGAAVAWLDAADLRDELLGRFGFDPRTLEEVTASVEATTEELRARVVLELAD